MYISLLKEKHEILKSQENEKNPVIPTWNVVMEAKSARYIKYVSKSSNDLKMYHNLFLEKYGSYEELFDIPHGCDHDGMHYEFIFMIVEMFDGAYKYIMAGDCRLFVMNNEGKTISTCHCKSR